MPGLRSLVSPLLLALLVAVSFSACGDDGGGDFTPPESCPLLAPGEEAEPGCPGGFCLAPDGWCVEGQCQLDAAVCYDAANPCRGFFCGGEKAGSCIVDMATGLPLCVCSAGYINADYAYYCEKA